LLGDPVLYSQALHMIGATPSLAARPVGSASAASERALTGLDGSLSSTDHSP
jgi:hypothetical protein